MGDSSKCPKCGTEVHVPVRTWTMMPRKGGGALLRITLYECPRCLSRWREVMKVRAAEFPRGNMP